MKQYYVTLWYNAAFLEVKSGNYVNNRYNDEKDLWVK